MIKLPPDSTKRDKPARVFAGHSRDVAQDDDTIAGQVGQHERMGPRRRFAPARRGWRCFLRRVAGQSEPQRGLKVIGLIAEDRRAGLAVDKQDSLRQPRLEGEIAAIVKRKLIAAA